MIVVMSKNPYASSSDVPERRNPNPTSRKLLWLGLLISLLSFLLFCFQVSRLFLLGSQLDGAVSPSEFAMKVSGTVTLIPVAILTGVVGLVLAIVGLLRSGKRVP